MIPCSIYSCSKRLLIGIITIISLSNLISLPQNVNGASFISAGGGSTSLSQRRKFGVSTMNQGNSKFIGSGMRVNYKHTNNNASNGRSRGSSMTMFLGTDGILGVGAPEIVSCKNVCIFLLSLVK